jgi:hypothetical protein
MLVVLPLAEKVDTMEQAHWLGRKRASMAMAEKAASSEARLIHYKLAGLYRVKAAKASRPQHHLEDAPQPEVYALRHPQSPPTEEWS